MALADGTIINAYISFFITQYIPHLLMTLHSYPLRQNHTSFIFCHPPCNDLHLHHPEMSNSLCSPALGPRSRTCTCVTCECLPGDKHKWQHYTPDIWV